MKTHTQDFKDNICLLGKQQEVQITYTINNEEIVLTGEDINSATPHYKADLLKSVMKELDLDSNIDIPVNTEINFKYGLLVDENYEYLDFGNYIVYSSEKQEDLLSYKIKCYDKLLYSMKEYESFNTTYPITIRNYINALCTHLGLTFANVNSTFTNYEKEIPAELFLDSEGNDIGYTYRDVLDQLAQVTGSIICLNNNDQVEIRYPNNTNDTINEEYLKDINVNFGEKYGAINTVILSRAEGADKISLSNPANLPDDEKIAIEIADNQIMNFNDRDTYLNALLTRLYGTEYYLNDFTSTGIVYYDLMDRYNVQIGDTTYNCLMLNNEVNIDQGLQETVYTKRPETSETDYTKTDKTDRRINQTYLIVDKQNQRIDGVITNVTEQNNKISQITQTVDELNAKIQDIADITKAQESLTGQVDLDGINESEPIMIKVHPITNSISYLYPRNNLYPSDTLYMPDRIIRFTRTYEEDGITKTQNIDYELPDDLLYYDSNTYDEFYLDYSSQTCQVTKRCGYNADGTVYALSQVVTNTYTYPQILLGDGDYTVKVSGYNPAYLFVRLMAQNIYTTQFATKTELTSSITQTKNEIALEVVQKLDENQFTGANILLQINDDTSLARISADKISLAGKEIDLTSDNIEITSNNFSVDSNGKMHCSDAEITGGHISLQHEDNSFDDLITLTGESNSTNYQTTFKADGLETTSSINNNTTQLLNIDKGNITCISLTQTSLEENKKNIAKYNNSAIDEIMKTDIYEYNLREENNTDKKHIGFVIGNNYNYSNRITQIDTNGKEIGVDNYSFISLCCKAIQEQQQQIENLQEQIKK